MLSLFEQERGTIMLCVPTMLIRMLDSPSIAQRTLSSWRLVTLGGAPVPPELVRRAREQGVKVAIGFGQTEASPYLTHTLPDDPHPDWISTVGRPMPQTEIKIVNTETGAIVPVGEIGEICARGYPLYRADANPGRLRHRRTGPVTGRRRWPSQRQGDHTFSNLRAQRWNARSPCLVPPKASGSFVVETFLPAPDHRLGLAGGLHDLSRAATIGRQKDDLCPPNVLLRAIAVGDHGLKLATVGSAQLDVRSLVHPPDSHTRVLQGIPRRIEVSDLVH
jgi:acyl-CoA synthetase (AMP-forming)/AMP-acid ligase II